MVEAKHLLNAAERAFESVGTNLTVNYHLLSNLIACPFKHDIYRLLLALILRFLSSFLTRHSAHRFCKPYPVILLRPTPL